MENTKYNIAPCRRLKKTLRVVLTVLLAVLFVLSLVKLLLHLLPQPGQPGLVDKPSSSPEVNDATIMPENPIDFSALQEKNPEIIGWISIPGTHIDYAVLQSGVETPEDYYINRDEEGNHRRSGSIYIQKANAADFTDPNTIVYGHYMANGSMFADLHQFRKEAFFKENDTIQLYLPGHILTYQIYSAFVYDDRHILYAYDFQNPDEYTDFLQETQEPPSTQRQVREGVTVTNEDRIITLSTCTAKEGERYLVVGVLISDQLTL